ncbi:MAG: pyruvate dehydrogenase (acetyl-transferring) E1 component subunit alpha [Gammaproteobacteria bacterium]|nr:pyruvate dehydrogenase (acetyl-transferring) E1 component subunit alpha [Gammaproteobacteria bacterium]
MTLVARFEVNYTQFLDEHGQAQGQIPAFAKDKATLLQLYRNMVLIRLFDKKAIALQRTGKMGTYAPVCGQEAIGTAMGHALKPDDLLIPYYRDYAAQVQRGVLLSEILTYWGGDERGNQFQNGGKDFSICVPIASQCLHAAGAAFAIKYKQLPHVAMVSIGDGGTSEGDFYEAINVAGLWELPLVFVINNNQWAISVPLNKQTRTQTLAQKAIAAGFEGVQVDGNDVIACREVMGEAVEKARLGKGPTLIEAISYRLSDHTTADDATRYQPTEERAAANDKEPIRRLKQFLMDTQGWTANEDQALQTECEAEVAEAASQYLTRPPQSIASAFDYHFATLPDYLIEQRATALEEEAHHA